MIPLVIASHNEGKVSEIRTLLTPLRVIVLSAASIGLPEPEESGATFAENAAIKSQSAASLSGHYALADDSGLCVEGLAGAPGIYSARWAGDKKNFIVAMNRIKEELHIKKVEPEGAAASFVCALSLTSPDKRTEIFEGIVHGKLSFPPRGAMGFGYDPIFIPEGYNATFSEMDPAVKHSLSHRAIAFEKFTAFLHTNVFKEKL